MSQSTVHHPALGRIDIYPVGALHDLLRASRALVVAGIPRERRLPMARANLLHAGRSVRRDVASQNWRGLRSTFNGYLAEPYDFPAELTRCGRGWTKSRALADLDAHARGLRP